MGGVVKTLRRSNALSLSIFSTAGSWSFGRTATVICVRVQEAQDCPSKTVGLEFCECVHAVLAAGKQLVLRPGS